jgi:hypothetical protein
MDTRTYTNITPEEFAAIEAKANQLTGMTLIGDEGEATGPHGVDIKWQYVAESATLTFTLKHYPPFCEGKVESSLDALVGAKGVKGTV